MFIKNDNIKKENENSDLPLRKDSILTKEDWVTEEQVSDYKLTVITKEKFQKNTQCPICNVNFGVFKFMTKYWYCPRLRKFILWIHCLSNTL